MSMSSAVPHDVYIARYPFQAILPFLVVSCRFVSCRFLSFQCLSSVPPKMSFVGAGWKGTVTWDPLWTLTLWGWPGDTFF
jgi:hypothetical protein